jgi:hypothetical protein
MKTPIAQSGELPPLIGLKIPTLERNGHSTDSSNTGNAPDGAVGEFIGIYGKKMYFFKVVPPLLYD